MQLRVNAGRSRAEVGLAGGVNSRTVERVETGFYANPRWSTISRILKGVGVSALNPVYGPISGGSDHVQPTLDDAG